MSSQKGALIPRQLPVDEREGRIAPQYLAPIARETLFETARERIDADDRRNTQRDTGDKNAKPGETAAQIAGREAKDRCKAAYRHFGLRPAPEPAHPFRYGRSAAAPSGRNGRPGSYHASRAPSSRRGGP